MTKGKTFAVVTICGSMTLYRAMLKTAQDLSKGGYIVLMPFVVFPSEKQKDQIKVMLDEMHFAKIDMSTAIVVVTDQSQRIGESTQNEINYAKSKNKLISYVRTNGLPNDIRID